jgi:putative transposase
VINSICQRFAYIANVFTQVIHRWVKPNNMPLLCEAALDLTRSKPQLILENAFLRQQLIVLNRQVKRPALKPRERLLLVVMTSRLQSWKQALNIVEPDTLLRWHRDLYRWLWKRKSMKMKQSGRPTISKELVALIQRMAKENRIWGAKRIRGELLKLGMRVA